MPENKPIKKLNRQIDESISNVLNYQKKIDVLLKKSSSRFGESFPILRAISENTTLSITKKMAILAEEIAILREKFEVFIKKTNELFESVHKSGVFPFSLFAFTIKSYNDIREIEVSSIPINTAWIFLIGENSFGKTSILQGITNGLHFTEENDDSWDIFSNCFASICKYEDNNYTLLHSSIEDRFPIQNHFACYGPSRLQIQSDQTKNDIDKKSTTTYSLFNSDGILLNIEFELLIWFLEKNPRFEAVKKTFLQLIPYLADIQVDVANRKVLYIEKEPNESGGSYNPVTFNQLASGFRSIIAMVGDMMIRLFKARPDVSNPSELSGIVIIDELDLHWHPKMQREIPALLSSIFPKVQFIASTHSLVPLLGAPENSVLLKVNRTLEEGITVERVSIDFAALSADVMLRDIFDLEKYMSDAKIKAWERHVELKGLIHFEKDDEKKQAYWDEYERLGDKFQFEL